MHYLRTMAWHCVIMLTCVSTLLAGTPQLRCVCAGAAIKVETAATEVPPCCCCTVAEEPSETPSCCAAEEAAPSDDGYPALDGRGCQKAVVHPEAASLLRPAAEVAASPAVAAGAPVAPPVSADAGHPRTSLAPFRELPAPDLQLLFQHFVI
jgi:hypothetical protein